MFRHLGDDLGIFGSVVVDEDPEAAGDQDHDQGHGDVHVGDGVLHVSEALTEDEEQQRHHGQSQQSGAGRHHDAEEHKTQTGMETQETTRLGEESGSAAG